MPLRASIGQFELANPLYRNASITFYTVAAGVKTSTLATLYAAQSGTSQLSNPQKLNSQGKLKQSVYIAADVIGTVTGISVASHDTAIKSPMAIPEIAGRAVESFTATAAQTIFNLAAAYTLGANQIEVFRNGLAQIGGGVDYTETNTTRITFVTGLLSAGDNITVKTWGP